MGVDSPHFRGTGIRSKALPPRLRQRVDEALNDPELLSTQFDIGMVTARMSQLNEQFDSGETGSAWRAVHHAHDQLQRLLAIAPLDVAAMQTALAQITRAITVGEQEAVLWRDIMDAQRHRAKLVETELKREERLEQNITAKQALTLVAVLKSLLFEVVTEQDKRHYIADRLERLLAKPSAAPPQADD
jgi:hypothetical protein